MIYLLDRVELLAQRYFSPDGNCVQTVRQVLLPELKWALLRSPELEVGSPGDLPMQELGDWVISLLSEELARAVEQELRLQPNSLVSAPLEPPTLQPGDAVYLVRQAVPWELQWSCLAVLDPYEFVQAVQGVVPVKNRFEASALVASISKVLMYISAGRRRF